MMSGHALEAGWFLLQYSAEWGDKELQKTAINKFVELPYERGWDTEHGGLFYFLDVDGHCPTQVNQSYHCCFSPGSGYCWVNLSVGVIVWYSWSGVWNCGGLTVRLSSPSWWPTAKPRSPNYWRDSLKFMNTPWAMWVYTAVSTKQSRSFWWLILSSRSTIWDSYL